MDDDEEKMKIVTMSMEIDCCIGCWHCEDIAPWDEPDHYVCQILKQDIPDPFSGIHPDCPLPDAPEPKYLPVHPDEEDK